MEASLSPRRHSVSAAGSLLSSPGQVGSLLVSPGPEPSADQGRGVDITASPEPESSAAARQSSSLPELESWIEALSTPTLSTLFKGDATALRVAELESDDRLGEILCLLNVDDVQGQVQEGPLTVHTGQGAVELIKGSRGDGHRRQVGMGKRTEPTKDFRAPGGAT